MKQSSDLQPLLQDEAITDSDEFEVLPDNLNSYTDAIDPINKYIIRKHPDLLLPYLNYVHHKNYPLKTTVRQFATEFLIEKPVKSLEGTENSAEKELETDSEVLVTRYSDMVVQIAEKDLFHLEFQARTDPRMLCRMFEYDTQCAIVHGMNLSAGSFSLPYSSVLYLETAPQNFQSIQKCKILHPDCPDYQYPIRNLRLRDFTPEIIAEHHLNLLVPFLPICFHQRLMHPSSKKSKQKALKALTGMVKKCTIILEQEVQNHFITHTEQKFLLETMFRICKYLYGKDDDIMSTVNKIHRYRFMTYEEQIAFFKNKNEQYAKENAHYAKENARYAKENSQYTKELTQLREELKLKNALISEFLSHTNA